MWCVSYCVGPKGGFMGKYYVYRALAALATVAAVAIAAGAGNKF